MNRMLMTIALAGAFVAPAFAQDAATLVCADYAAMDNAGQMAALAELESLTAESATEMTSEELATHLSADCTANPDKLVLDAVKEMKKM